MKVLIFEGIATSGKSTVTSSLQKALPGLKVVLAEESETHIPIMKESSSKHIGFFVNLISRLSSEKPDVLIFDRLYLTQAFRTKCDISDYSEIEELLNQYSASTIFFKVDENAIEDRILKASKHRGSEFFKSRGGTSKQRAQYYVDQQKYQLKLLERSKIPYMVINTTSHDYKQVVQELLAYISKK
jgi:thymidylate kinase